MNKPHPRIHNVQSYPDAVSLPNNNVPLGIRLLYRGRIGAVGPIWCRSPLLQGTLVKVSLRSPSVCPSSSDRVCVPYSMLSLAETRDRTLSFSREEDFMRWFLAALLTIGVVIATRAGLEPFQYLLLPANWLDLFNICC